MDKNYRKIDFDANISIEEAVKELTKYNKRGELVCGSFNGHMLYSDKVTVDSAYLEILGRTKAVFDREKAEWLENTRSEREEYEARIPKLTKEWMEKGHEILDERYWGEWDRSVSGHLSGLYEGILQNCLEIVEGLNRGCSFDEARGMLEKQEHSGMSCGLVVEMVKAFCDRGREFADKLY